MVWSLASASGELPIIGFEYAEEVISEWHHDLVQEAINKLYSIEEDNSETV